MFTRSVIFNHDNKVFQDKRVRQAFNHAIDTDLIIKRLVKDKAYRAVSWLPLSSPAFDKSVKPYAYDPEKAKKLLAEAGYPNGFEFELTTSQNESWGLPIVEAIIPMLAKAGIKVKPKMVEATVLTDIAMKGEHQALISSNSDRSGLARDAALLLLQDAANGLPLRRLQQSGIRQAARRAAASLDPAKRNDLLRQANNLLYDEAPVWFFNYNKAVLAYQPWIHGLQANPTEITQQYPEDIWVDAKSPAK